MRAAAPSRPSPGLSFHRVPNTYAPTPMQNDDPTAVSGNGNGTRAPSLRPVPSTPPARATQAAPVDPPARDVSDAPDVGSLPIPDYDELSASQVVERLEGLAPQELDAVHAYEAAHRGRNTILGKLAQLTD